MLSLAHSAKEVLRLSPTIHSHTNSHRNAGTKNTLPAGITLIGLLSVGRHHHRPHLPPSLAGLVITAICCGLMSTVTFDRMCGQPGHVSYYQIPQQFHSPRTTTAPCYLLPGYPIQPATQALARCLDVSVLLRCIRSRAPVSHRASHITASTLSGYPPGHSQGVLKRPQGINLEHIWLASGFVTTGTTPCDISRHCDIAMACLTEQCSTTTFVASVHSPYLLEKTSDL